MLARHTESQIYEAIRGQGSRCPLLRLDDSLIVESEEVSPGVVLDYNESNEVVGVEMLHLSKRSTNLDLSALHFETV